MPAAALKTLTAVSCLLFTSFGLSAPAHAVTLQAFAAATSNADFTNPDSSLDVELASTSGAVGFSTAFDVVATAAYPGGTGPTHDPIGGHTENVVALSFTITFDVVAAPTEFWEMDLTGLVDASVSILDDTPGTGVAYLSAAQVRREPDQLFPLAGIPESLVSATANDAGGFTLQGQGTESVSLVVLADLDLDSPGANEGLIFCGVLPCGISYSAGDTVTATLHYELQGQLAVPEPALGLLAGLGVAGVVFRVRRRAQRRSPGQDSKLRPAA